MGVTRTRYESWRVYLTVALSEWSWVSEYVEPELVEEIGHLKEGVEAPRYDPWGIYQTEVIGTEVVIGSWKEK